MIQASIVLKKEIIISFYYQNLTNFASSLYLIKIN